MVDNGVYEAPAARPLGTLPNARWSAPNFADLARAAGFTEVYEFDDVESFRFEHELHGTGPVCIVLKTTHQTEDISARSPGPPAERIQTLRAALQS